MTSPQEEGAKISETIAKMNELIAKKEELLVTRRADFEAKKGTEGFEEEVEAEKLRVFEAGIKTDKEVVVLFEKKKVNLEAGH